jgi:hypothetical protein
MPNTEVRSERIGSHTSSPSAVSTLKSSTGTAPVHPSKRGPPPPLKLPPSPADSDMSTHERPSSSLSDCTAEETRLTRNIDRGAPGDQAIFSENKTPQQRQIAKKRSQYYQDTFAAREPNSSARERVSRDSMVLAEIKTNVIVRPPLWLSKDNPNMCQIQDEYSFITDLSYSLSTRYQRPESSILVTVAHSACMVFGGSFDPAYTMSITALKSQLQPITNKRNSTLLAKTMEESLGVSANRGIIKFLSIAEEDYATDGKTVAGEIEELERLSSEEPSALQRGLSKASGRDKRNSTKSLRKLKSTPQLPTHDEGMTPPSSGRQFTTSPMLPPMPPTPSTKSIHDRQAEKVKKMGRRKSFIATILGK